jgi:hypothetical protein
MGVNAPMPGPGDRRLQVSINALGFGLTVDKGVVGLPAASAYNLF